VNASRIALACAALALLALPGAASAASLVPPGNSAANQYTETFPTTGGNAEAKGKKAAPGAVLGAGNAKKLDSKGKEGREAAAVVAATAPPTQTGGSAGGAGSAPGGQGDTPAGNGSANGQPSRGGSGGAGDASHTSSASTTTADSDGSSGLGEVLGQATGSSSSGGIGFLLPLIVLASVVWAVAFFLRRRRTA
jgi:cobalamin biosynthesis Mg chelatase CobN